MTYCAQCGGAHDEIVELCPATGLPVSAPGPCGTRIDRYDVERLLGIGGFGAVYLAHHSMLRQAVAVKLLRKQRLTDSRSIERFLREARAAAAVHHPHIVEMLDCGVAPDGQPFLVMELLAGKDLADVLAARRRLALGDAAEIMAQVLDALSAAHARGVVHRDMKPSNILLLDRDPDGGGSARPFVKLLDFGISKLVHEQTLATHGSSVLGTPAYMAPEQLLEPGTIDHRADLYAVAVMLYEMLSGRLPFEGDSVAELLRRALTERPPALRSIAPEVPPRIAAVVERGLARDRDARWRSARELADALHGALLGQEPEPVTLGPSTARLQLGSLPPASNRPPPGSRPPPGPAATPSIERDATIPSVSPPPLPASLPPAVSAPSRPPPAVATATARPTTSLGPWLGPVVALGLVAIIALAAAVVATVWAFRAPQLRAQAPPPAYATLEPAVGGASPTVVATPGAGGAPLPTPTPQPPAVVPSPTPPPSTPDDPEPQPPQPTIFEGPDLQVRGDERDGVRFAVVRITGAHPGSPDEILSGLDRLRTHFTRCRQGTRTELVRLRVITQYDGRAATANADERNPGGREATGCALGAVNAAAVFPRTSEIITFDVLLRRQ